MKDALIGSELGCAVRDVADAMGFKGMNGNWGFRCPECKEAVKPHKGGMQGPHFEHLARNPKCSLSDT